MYKASNTRYDDARYNRLGRSGLKLPVVSLGFWHNFGDISNFDNMKKMCFTAFDNGNRNKSSRVVFYRLDEENRRLKDFRSYALGGKFSYACGSAQRIRDELYVIGWGWATGDAECMTVYDFAAGKALMTVTLGNPKNLTYRCVYYD